MRSLTIKLTLAFVFVSLIGAALAALIIRQRTQAEFQSFLLDQRAARLVVELAEYYAQHGSWDNIASTAFQTQFIDPGNDAAAGPGEKVGGKDLPGRRSGYLLVSAQGVILLGSLADVGKPAPEDYTQNSLPVEVDGRVVGWLLADRNDARRPPDVPEDAFLKNVSQAILFGALFALALAVLVGALLARALTRPLRELTHATRAIAKGELGYQVKAHSDDELGELVDSFNQMSADLAQSNQARRQMTADIAHDLRTPLSILLGYTEALSDGKLHGSEEIYTVMHREAGHLKLLIDDLRTLSLADSGELPLERQAIQPAELLQRAAAAHQALASEKDVHILVEAAADLPDLHVDPERMAQVLGNLLGNALRYTPEQGEIILRAAAVVGGVRLEVQDSGAGIAPEDLPHVFNRFYRGNKSRQQNGEAGLGLAIAKSLVEAHGSTIKVQSKLGEGTIFIILLPVG